MTRMPGEKFHRQVQYQKRHTPRSRKMGKNNKHHLTNRCKGGKDTSDNLLVIDRSRHARLHEMFKNMSWEEIHDALKSIFGVGEPQKVVAVMERVSRMKGRAA